TCLESGPARQKPSIVDALNATRWMAKQRPCRPAGTLVCQSELLDAEMTGIIRNKMKPATATSVTEGHIPCAAMHTPARSEKASTPWIRFRGPPHAVIATPPSSNPKPLIAYCTPSRAGPENDKTNGATMTQAMENRNLLEPYTPNSPIRPGLSCTYRQPTIACCSKPSRCCLAPAGGRGMCAAMSVAIPTTNVRAST